LWGQCPHNRRVQPVELDVSVELASIAARHSEGAKSVGQAIDEALAVLAPVLASPLELLDLAPDEPVPQRESEVDGLAGLPGKLVVDRPDLLSELLEFHAPPSASAWTQR
jgi:hypothetical protein